MKREVVALWLAARDPRVRWPIKLLAGAVAAYALSPIDLIPDFVPVFGLVDDLLILPLGIWFALRLLPDEVMAELRQVAEEWVDRPISRGGGAVIVILWLSAAISLGWWWVKE